MDLPVHEIYHQANAGFKLHRSRSGAYLEVPYETVGLSEDGRLGFGGPIFLGQVAGGVGAVVEIVEGEAALGAAGKRVKPQITER